MAKQPPIGPKRPAQKKKGHSSDWVSGTDPSDASRRWMGVGPFDVCSYISQIPSGGSFFTNQVQLHDVGANTPRNDDQIGNAHGGVAATNPIQASFGNAHGGGSGATNPIQASFGKVNKDNEMRDATKVEKLRPDMSDVTLTVKVVGTKIVGMQFADCLVGDETGMIIFRAANDQVDLMKEGLTVTLQNAKVDMFKDSMRLVVDESGSVQVAEPAGFTVKEDSNLSLIQASFGNVNKDNATKVEKLRPVMSDVTLTVKVVSTKIAGPKGRPGGPRSRMQFADCLVGDETGMIVFRATNDQVDLMKEGLTVTLQNAKVDMFKDSMRLVVDESGSVQVAEPAGFTVKEDSNLSLIQASFGNVNKDNATKVEKLRPVMSDVTLTVKVVSTKIAGPKGRPGGPRSRMQFADCLVGDETGMIVFRATNDQVDLMKEGLTVTLQNAKVDMFKDSMRLVVDESGSVQVAEPAGFTVKEDSNLSLIQASFGNVNKDNATKVEKLRPVMSDVTLTVKVVSTKIAGPKGRPGGPRSRMQFADCLVGDETGMIVFRATNDQVDLMKEGLTVTLQNAKVDMFKDSMRLVVDESGSVQVAEPAGFTVKEDSNLSLIQASFGNVNKDNATKVEKLRPVMSDVTLTVKVVSTKIAGPKGRPGGPRSRMQFADCLVGDETGMIVFRATNDQVDLMKEGLTVTLQNAKVDMFKDSMRLVVDESGSVQVAEPAGFTVKEDSNLSLIQASFGNVNKDNATKVEKLRPVMSDVTLTVKVVSTKIAGPKGRPGGPRSRMQFADCLVGDETGMIVFRATNDQVDLMKEGLTVTLQNAKVDMFKDSMRLVVDESGSVQVAEPAGFTVKEDNNLSLIEFECVHVYT